MYNAKIGNWYHPRSVFQIEQPLTLDFLPKTSLAFFNMSAAHHKALKTLFLQSLILICSHSYNQYFDFLLSLFLYRFITAWSTP